MNAKIARRAAASSAAAALAAVLALSALPGQPAAPSWRFSTPATAPVAVSAPGGSAWDVGPAEPAPSTAAMQPPVDGGDVQDDGDEGIDPSSAWLSPNDGRVQVYAEAPSVLPGQPLRLHASTTASSFSITVSREGVAPVTVFSHAGYPGHDYRSRRTVDLAMHTVRANWPVAATISTAGWRTGVYTVFARDSLGRTSGAVFAVRDASPSTGAALFVLPVMDYQAYNAWGGSSFYSTPRAYQVSFDRPIDRNGGQSYWPVYDRKILQWLEGHGYPLRFTTDYDLAANPPAVAPRVLVLPQHTEYVPASLYNWVDRHVNVRGDMSVALLGANSFYWQTRLVAGPGSAARPNDVLSYKDCSIDPIRAFAPWATTCLWRSSVVGRPESGLFGAMYSGVVDGGRVRHDETVARTAPAWALAGTGWRPGTVLRGIMLGEADQASAADGGVVISSGTAPYLGAGTLRGTMTVRQSPAGGRVFDAGTFLFGAVLGGQVQVGVSHASVDRFARNVMAWLGLAARR